MSPAQTSLCEKFADGILMHFRKIGIVCKYEVFSDMVRVRLSINNKTVATNIPLGVIMNIGTNLEARQVIRYEIIEELTNGIKKTGTKR